VAPLDTIRDLHQAGLDAIAALVTQLRVVDPDVWRSDADQAVWRERALRSLTGQLFRFTTAEKLNQRQAELAQGSQEPWGFFAERMSNARLALAPRDVQAKIIAAWKAWLEGHSRTLDVRPYVFSDAWYF
jgi:hypothetical protein